MPSAVGAACSTLDVVPDPPPLPVPDPGPPDDDDEGGFGVGGATVVDTFDARSISSSEGLEDKRSENQVGLWWENRRYIHSGASPHS